MSENSKLKDLFREVEIPDSPRTFVDYHEELGNKRVDTGCIEMPLGYTLMRSFDKTYYYWLKSDGTTGGAHNNKWETVKLAKNNSTK